jgi:hypothetical protein
MKRAVDVEHGLGVLPGLLEIRIQLLNVTGPKLVQANGPQVGLEVEPDDLLVPLPRLGRYIGLRYVMELVGGIRGAAGINFAVLSEAARDVARLALQVPFTPTTPPAVQVQPSPGPSPAPSPAVTPAPGEWRLIGTKGPTPRNTKFVRRSTSPSGKRGTVRRVGVLYVQIELYERPTGDARISVLWRLPGSKTPKWVLHYYPASGRIVFGRYVIIDEVRRLWQVDPVSVSGVKVSITGSFIDVSVPLAALQPDSPKWEIQVATFYLAPDNTIAWVDWLPRTRISP